MSSSTRRRSSLLLELGRAQSKIATLEDFIRDRERQFRATVVNLERQDSLQSAMMRTRRAGLSHDMFRIRSMSHEEQDEIDGKDAQHNKCCFYTVCSWTFAVQVVSINLLFVHFSL